MKKRQIEKIPYITLPAVSETGHAMYVAVTAVEEIGDESVLLLEVYRNEPDCLAVPRIRYAVTGRDWSVFHPETGKWHHHRITDSYGALCWVPESEMHKGDPEYNILYSPGDMERIMKFFNGGSHDVYKWWWWFEKHEESIRAESRDRLRERRRERLEERKRNTPELRERELLSWADEILFHGKHILFYRKKGSRAMVCCSACGGVSEGRWKKGPSYEQQYEHLMEEPVNMHPGRCPVCGAYGIYRPQGFAHRDNEQQAAVFLADRYVEKQKQGIVLRYIRLFKNFQLEERAGNLPEPEMVGACEILEGIEQIRYYFVPGRKMQADYHKHDPYQNMDFWDDCNITWGNAISSHKAKVHPDTWAALEGTYLQYCGMEEYAMQKDGVVDAKEYLLRYLDFPQMEMLSKMGLTAVVDDMVMGFCGIISDPAARRPDSFLGIRKERVKLLRQEKGSLGLLKALQLEKYSGQNWTEDQIRALAELGSDNLVNVGDALKIMTIQKMLNNICRYAGCGYGSGCTEAVDSLRRTAGTYFDYLDMRRQLGYDMNNTVYQSPRNLNAAHDRMVMEINKEEQDKRILKVAAKYGDIRRRYRELRKQYFYQDERYLIRPAKSAEEIVAEGRILHHCVGGDNYLGRHDKGISCILMLRHADDPENPYITVEIDPHCRILQWYGAYDKKPDKENIQEWLDAYVEWLKDPERKAGNREQESLVMAAAV